MFGRDVVCLDPFDLVTVQIGRRATPICCTVVVAVCCGIGAPARLLSPVVMASRGGMLAVRACRVIARRG